MSGKGELVRYTQLRAPKEKDNDQTVTYKKLKQTISDLIDSAADDKAKITIIALVEPTEEELAKALKDAQNKP